jgi:hypothetical protein
LNHILGEYKRNQVAAVDHYQGKTFKTIVRIVEIKEQGGRPILIVKDDPGTLNPTGQIQLAASERQKASAMKRESWAVIEFTFEGNIASGCIVGVNGTILDSNSTLQSIRSAGLLPVWEMWIGHFRGKTPEEVEAILGKPLKTTEGPNSTSRLYKMFCIDYPSSQQLVTFVNGKAL